MLTLTTSMSLTQMRIHIPRKDNCSKTTIAKARDLTRMMTKIFWKTMTTKMESTMMMMMTYQMKSKKSMLMKMMKMKTPKKI